MILCPQCNGYKSTLPDNQEVNAPNSTTFTAPTQVPLNPCNYCQGVGYFTGAGS